ncbi:MAG: hypothetical protein H6Q52_2181 [Deltaproteobacteria bacterium]|nr:hypothetical protein [Deltaproteobacteria bacterium]
MSLASCSYLPFGKKKDEDPSKTAKKTDSATAKTSARGEAEEVKEPQMGDIKVIDGIEYIYTRNRKYMLTPYEPPYVWVRKDQYKPGIGESLSFSVGGSGGPTKKERDDLEKRIAKLEEELKKKGIQPGNVYPTQMGSLPVGLGYMPGLISFEYPSPKMKRRIIVLPVTDQTNYKSEGLGELATKRLISRLESTGTVICVDPNTLNIRGSYFDAANARKMNNDFGIQAILKTTLSDVYTSSSRIEGKDENETSFAMSKLAIDIFNTETGRTMKQLSGRNPISLSREKGDLSSEKAKIKAIDLAIEMIAEDVLKTVLSVDWHSRIASIEGTKVYINAGRLSGLEKGKVLEVYAPGEEVIDPKTKQPLGRKKGAFKGELEVVELFGVDASWAKMNTGGSFSSSDLVYVKQISSGL